MASATRYRITIVELTTAPETKRDYKVIADSGNQTDGGRAYGYVTYTEDTMRETKFYEQTVDELNIWSVVSAINGMGGL